MKTTRELEHRIRTCKDPAALLRQDGGEVTLTGYLHELLEQRGLTVGKVIQCCNLDRSYGYQLFNGTRRPPRNMLVTLALHLELGEKEAQRLLKLAGRPPLYARNRRDAALLYALHHHLTPAQAEELLNGLEVHTLEPDI